MTDCQLGGLLGRLESDTFAPVNTATTELGADLRELLDRTAAEGLPCAPGNVIDRCLTLLRTGRGSLYRHHFAPGHFTASGFVVTPDLGQVLLIRHRKLRLWLQPGGHLEQGDASLADAARREVREETGLEKLEVLRPLFDVDIHEIPPIGQEPGHLHFDLRVAFLAQPGQLRANSEVVDAAWFSVDHVLARGSSALAGGRPTDRSVQRALAGLRGS